MYFSSKAGSLSNGRSACTYDSSIVFVDGTSGGLDEVLAVLPSAGCTLSLSAQKPWLRHFSSSLTQQLRRTHFTPEPIELVSIRTRLCLVLQRSRQTIQHSHLVSLDFWLLGRQGFSSRDCFANAG